MTSSYIRNWSLFFYRGCCTGQKRERQEKVLNIRNVVDSRHAVVVGLRLLHVIVLVVHLHAGSELARLGARGAAGPGLVLNAAQVLTHLPAVVPLGSERLAPRVADGPVLEPASRIHTPARQRYAVAA